MGKLKKMNSLPEDLIISILVKLQVKPLMRFRCVCKWWYHLIKSPDFIEMHQRSPQNKKNECILVNRVRNLDYKPVLSYYLYESLDEISPHLEVPYFNGNNKYEISWPCNGLLLCVSIADKTSFLNDVDHRGVSVLCNPATRESKLLPPNPFHVHRERLWENLFGLGFDSNQNDYKVVTIEYKDKAHIYNISTNSWRQIDHVMPYIYDDIGGVPFNGALHWPANRNNINIILSFDVSTEVFQDINLPEVIAHDDQDTAKKVTLLNECLAMFTFNHVWDIELSTSVLSTFVDIWVMKVGSWTKQMSISGLVTDDLISPRLFWKNEAILFDTHFHGYFKLKLWARDSHEMSETGISSYDDNKQSVMLYRESLVSVMPFD